MKKIIISVDTAEESISMLNKEIDRIRNFVRLAEEYPVDTIEQRVIKYYAYIGKVKDVAIKLNEEGYKIGNRKWQHNDVSAIIDKASKDEFHILVRNEFKKRRDSVRYK